jgi:hypothetical protein
MLQQSKLPGNQSIEMAPISWIACKTRGDPKPRHARWIKWESHFLADRIPAPGLTARDAKCQQSRNHPF